MAMEVLALTFALTMQEVSQRPKYEFIDDHFVIHRDIGGDVFQYAFHFALIKRQGSPVIVEGDCWSACTMVLANPKACAMPNTRFGFHQARLYNRQNLEVSEVSKGGNDILWSHYPEKVRARLGNQLPPYMVYIKGTELLPQCQ